MKEDTTVCSFRAAIAILAIGVFGCGTEEFEPTSGRISDSTMRGINGHRVEADIDVEPNLEELTREASAPAARSRQRRIAVPDA